MPQLSAGFEKANSNNLPEVDSEMVQDYFANNTQYVSAEVRHGKTKRYVNAFI